LAEALAEALAPKAKENMATGGKKSGRGRKQGSPKLATPIPDVREQAAKEAGVSEGSMSAYKFAKANATTEELAGLKLSSSNSNAATVKPEGKARGIGWAVPLRRGPSGYPQGRR